MPDPLCRCGSGEDSYMLSDARGIPVGRVCSECVEEVKAKFRTDIFEDGDYECDEPIEEEEW